VRAVRAGSLLDANANSGQKDTVVVSATGFSVNQIVIIADDNHLETNLITSISGTTLTMDTNLSHSYTTAANGYVDPAIAEIEPKMIVTNGSGDQDLSTRVRSFNLSYGFESGCYSLDVTFTNTYDDVVTDGLGLDPRDSGSTYNASDPLLGAYHAAKLQIKKEGGSYITVFEGYAGPSDVSSTEDAPYSGTVTATFVGVSQPLKDWAIEERYALTYENATIASGGGDLLNQMITDQSMSHTITYADNPNYTVTKYTVSNVMLWEALENALAPTGYRLIEKWDGSNYKVTVKDPDRSQSTPIGIFDRTFKSRRLSGNESDVRTYVVIAYRDGTTGRAAYVEAKSTDAIRDKYGIPDGAGNRVHKKMVYLTKDASLIDSQSEATDLGTAMIHDLEKPSPDSEVEIPWLDFNMEAFDYHRFIHDTYTLDMGVMNINWEWSAERMVGRTVLTGTADRVIGTRAIWLRGDVKREGVSVKERLDEISDEVPPTPSQASATGSWYLGPDGTPKPVIDVIFDTQVPWFVTGRVVRITGFTNSDDGTATGGAAGYLDDSGQAWTTNEFQSGRHYIFIESGTGAGQNRLIKSNTATRINVETDFDTNPSSDSVYYILLRDRESYETNMDLKAFRRIADFEEGKFVGIEESWIPAGRRSG